MPATVPKALLFDLDGTLIDSLGDLHVAINRSLSEISARSLTREEVAKFIGKGARNMVERSLTAVLGTAPSRQQAERLYARYIFYMQEVNGQHSELLPAVFESLSQLQEVGYKMAVVTNKPNVVIPPLLERFKLSKFFSVVLGADSVAHPKPHPDMLLKAINLLGVDFPHTFMIGDSLNDALAARNAGIASLLLKTGYNEGLKIEQWAQLYAPDTPVFDTMRELTQYLLPFQRSPL